MKAIVRLAASVVALCPFLAWSQTTGDFRSQDSGNWSDVAVWEVFNGAAWVNATSYPGQNSIPDEVGISLAGIDLDVSPPNPINNLEVAGLATLDVIGNVNLTVNGNVTVAGFAAFTFSGNGNLTVGGDFVVSGIASFEDDNGTGTTTINGLVDLSNLVSFTTTAITDETRMILRSGISSTASTFVGGAATFNTNNQTLTGTGISFANNVVVTGVVVTNNATVSMTDTGTGTLSGTGTWQQGTGTLTYSGQTLTVTTFEASAVGNTVNYNRTPAGVQTIRNPSNSTYYNLTLSGNGNRTKTLQANTVVSGDLNITGTAIFSVSTFSLSVAGNWTAASSNADQFTEGTQTVTFNGTSQQTITANDAEGVRFYNLVINNSSAARPQLTFSADANNQPVVTNSLTMQRGVVNLNGRTFTIGTAAAAASNGSIVHDESRTSGWLYGGTLQRFISTTAVPIGNLRGFYPMGTDSEYRPLYLGTTGVTTGGRMGVAHTGATTFTNVNINDSGTTIVRRDNSFWDLTNNAMAGGTYSLRIGGRGFDRIGIVTGSTVNVRMATGTGVTGTHAATIGSVTEPLVNRTGITLANLTGSTFHVASTDITDSPLPIQLVYFKGRQLNNAVEFTWETASERDNHYFTIQRLRANDGFDAIGDTPGHGTTNEVTAYQDYDHNPIDGKNYYRLKQTDFDGNFSYSDLIMVEFQSSDNRLELYPNPAANTDVTIRLRKLEPLQEVSVRIVNAVGMEVTHVECRADDHGMAEARIPSAQLSPGVYVIVSGISSIPSRKLVIR